MLRRLLTPRWLLGLLLTLAAAAGMVRLGRWQLGRGEMRHSLQNYSYAVEWVLFAAFTIFCFVKLLREDGADEGVDSAAEVAPERPSAVLPRPETAPDERDEPDDELAAYNAYLARLHADRS